VARQQVSPTCGGSDLELTKTCVVYVYSTVELLNANGIEQRDKKGQRETTSDRWGQVRTEPAGLGTARAKKTKD